MEKLFNWTIGSFFRTIGRLIAYFAIGAFIAYILSNSNIKLPRITNLFLDHVNAEEIVIPVGSPTPLWFGVSDWSSGWQLYNNDTQLHKLITSRTSLNQPIYDYVSFQSGWTSNVDYVEFEFRFSQPRDVSNTNYNAEDDISCRQWTCESYNNSGNCSQFKCLSWYTNTGQYEQTTIQSSSLNGLQFYFEVYNSNDNIRACTINSGRILCPTFGYQILSLRMYTYWETSPTSQQLDFYLMRNARGYKVQNTYDAIQNQTQQQQQQHNETMTIVTDTNTTQEQNETTSFFENFTFSSDNSGLVGVITAPLRVINSVVAGQFSDLCFTLKSKNVCFPNGNMIWQKSNRDSTWFGSGSLSSGIQAFVSLFNLVAGGYILYKMGVSIKRLTEDLINPTNTRIEVMKL